jgi:chromatin remodeling complex protein RSC6
MATKGSSKGGGKGLSAAVQPSADLAPIVGDQPIPRSEVTKRVWDYIKANKLQDQQNKRMINADDKLRKIFGGKDQVSMFEMTALVNKHLKA